MPLLLIQIYLSQLHIKGVLILKKNSLFKKKYVRQDNVTVDEIFDFLFQFVRGLNWRIFRSVFSVNRDSINLI